MTPASTIALHRDVLLLPLTHDGRVADDAALERIEGRRSRATDVFLFCHGWLHDQAETRQAGARFFSLLDGALRPLDDRVRPLRIALHWPSKPFAEEPSRSGSAEDGVWPELVRMMGDPDRLAPDQAHTLLRAVARTEIPAGPEEEAELDGLTRRLGDVAARRGGAVSAVHALSFWTMKRRAGQVGERLGREVLRPLFGNADGLRVHLIGHSFGAKLATAAVLGGARAESLTLLLPAFSAFAFATEVPGYGRPGVYRAVVSERRVAGPIVVLRSDHDRALTTLYPAVTGSGQVDRGGVSTLGRRGQTREVVAASAMGAVGARGVGATEVSLVDAQTTGLPDRPVVNVNGSQVVNATDWLLGAHGDIYHPEIAALVLMGAGLLRGSPEGVRPARRTPLAYACR